MQDSENAFRESPDSKLLNELNRCGDSAAIPPIAQAAIDLMAPPPYPYWVKHDGDARAGTVSDQSATDFDTMPATAGHDGGGAST